MDKVRAICLKHWDLADRRSTTAMLAGQSDGRDALYAAYVCAMRVASPVVAEEGCREADLRLAPHLRVVCPSVHLVATAPQLNHDNRTHKGAA